MRQRVQKGLRKPCPAADLRAQGGPSGGRGGAPGNKGVSPGNNDSPPRCESSGDDGSGSAARLLFGGWRFLLTVLSRVYRGGAGLYHGLYDRGLLRPRSLPVPVIVVGNITVGGTGKTPVADRILRELAAAGIRPALVSRGYGGSRRGPVLRVADGDGVHATPEEAGDEPLLLASRNPGAMVFVGADRCRVGREAVACGAGVLVLDDGFQHRRLARDLNILLLDATRPFGGDHLLPRGLLREPPAAISRADAVLITRSDQVGGRELEQIARRVRRHNPAAPVFHAVHRPAEVIVRGREGADRRPPGYLRGTRAHLASGIANHGAFRATAVECGVRIHGESAYADHTRYSDAEAEDLRKKARGAGAQCLLTTEKDYVKLARHAGWSDAMPLVCLRVEVSLRGPEADAAFRRLLLRAAGVDKVPSSPS